LRWLNDWKLVVVYQGNDAHDLHQWKPIERRLVGRLLAAADCVIAVSRTLLEKVSQVFPGLRLNRSCLIPNGAPLDLLDKLKTAAVPSTLPMNYVLTAGHLIHRKGIDVLIEALRQVRQKGIGLEIVVAGDGPERSNLQELAARAGVSRHIRFLGNQSQEHVLQLMKHCLFFVLASRAEGLPLVIAEAMACGKAVIATNVDGIPEIVEHARTGLLVQPENPQSLADALIELHENAARRQDLANAAREGAIVQFSWESIADRYLSCLRCQEVR
jgi:glycosyltransferase involved in cell wall biosynthesis